MDIAQTEVPLRDGDESDRIRSLVALEKYAQRTGETIIEVPFPCNYCELDRMDFQMVDGDGFPMCVKCFKEFADAIGEVMDSNASKQ